MINKFPKWVEIGSFILALTAGSINTIALLGFNHQGASHLTGVSSLLGVELAAGNFNGIAHLTLIIVSFILGAAVSGVFIGNKSLQLSRRYGLALIVESLLMICAIYYLNEGLNLGHYLASGACGLQNAMTSTFSGAVVRTTHVTGLFTDLGITIGLMMRRELVNKRRVILYVILITGFILGGVIGALGFNAFKFYAMLIPASLTATSSAAYFTLLQKNKYRG